MKPFPSIGAALNGQASFSNANVIDAASEKGALIFVPTKTGNISHIHFRTGTHTTGATLDIRAETVGATDGFPTGTLWGTNTNGAQLTAAANTIYRVALTASAAVTRGGSPIAIVIVNPAVSFGNMALSSLSAGLPNGGMPYSVLFTGTWAATTSPYIIGVEYDDGTFSFLPNSCLLSSTANETYSSSTNPNHRGLRFQLSRAESVFGWWAYIDLDGDADVLLVADNWDGNVANALGRTILDKDVRGATAGRNFWLPFDADVSLLANTTYRLIVKPTTATSLTISTMSVSSAAMWDQSDAGQQFYFTEANNPNDATDWVDSPLERPFMGLLLNDGTPAAGAGIAALVGGGLVR